MAELLLSGEHENARRAYLWAHTAARQAAAVVSKTSEEADPFVHLPRMSRKLTRVRRRIDGLTQRLAALPEPLGEEEEPLFKQVAQLITIQRAFKNAIHQYEALLWMPGAHRELQEMRDVFDGARAVFKLDDAYGTLRRVETGLRALSRKRLCREATFITRAVELKVEAASLLATKALIVQLSKYEYLECRFPLKRRERFVREIAYLQELAQRVQEATAFLATEELLDGNKTPEEVAAQVQAGKHAAEWLGNFIDRQALINLRTHQVPAPAVLRLPRA